MMSGPWYFYQLPGDEEEELHQIWAGTTVSKPVTRLLDVDPIGAYSPFFRIVAKANPPELVLPIGNGRFPDRLTELYYPGTVFPVTEELKARESRVCSQRILYFKLLFGSWQSS